jgi:hypothetical protein
MWGYAQIAANENDRRADSVRMYLSSIRVPVLLLTRIAGLDMRK